MDPSFILALNDFRMLLLFWHRYVQLDPNRYQFSTVFHGSPHLLLINLLTHELPWGWRGNTAGKHLESFCFNISALLFIKTAEPFHSLSFLTSRVKYVFKCLERMENLNEFHVDTHACAHLLIFVACHRLCPPALWPHHSSVVKSAFKQDTQLGELGVSPCSLSPSTPTPASFVKVLECQFHQMLKTSQYKSAHVKVKWGDPSFKKTSSRASN